MNVNFLRLTVLIAGILALNTGCTNDKKFIRSEGMIWNTVYHISYNGPENLQDSILPVLNKVGRSLSVFDQSSLVSRLNNSDSLKVDADFIIVYDASKKINRLSHGRFDPTVSPLVDAWGFGPGHQPTRDTLMIDSIMEFVGLEKTHRDGDLIIKDDIRTRFNFSAIAKGYGCDAVGEMLKRNGVKDFMIEIGGELILSGNSPSGKEWHVAVDAPVDGVNPGEQTALILALTDVGIATSGNYRNFRMEEGRKVAHTISAVTGRPYAGEILSATIIAPTCMEADAIATACLASPLEEAQRLLKVSDVEGLFIFEDSMWMTPGFSKFVFEENSATKN